MLCPRPMKRVSLMLMLPLVSLACGEDRFGEGVSRPPTVLPERPEVGALRIREVAAGAQAFVEVENTTAEALDLDGYALVDGASSLALAGSVAPGARSSISGVEALVGANSGELAILNPSGSVIDYVAWGNDPATRSSRLYSEAFQNAVELLNPVALAVPFPLPADTALAFEAADRGCATPSPSSAPADLAPCPGGDGRLTLTEVAPEVDDSDWIELRNDGAEALNLVGARVCALPRCAIITAATADLAPGAYGLVVFAEDLAGAEAQASLPCDTTVCAVAPALSGLPSAPEITVAAPSPEDISALEPMLTYARFGSGSVGETVAADTSLWPEAGSVGIELEAGNTFQLPEGSAPAKSAWISAAPTPGAPTP